MKTNARFRTGIAFGAVALGLALSTPSAAMASSVDEFGHGVFFLDTSVAGQMQADPGPGGLNSALTYQFLPRAFRLALTPGDVVLEDSRGAISDIVRFNAQDTAPGYGAGLVFYSVAGDDVAAPADAGLPTALYQNPVVLRESGDARYSLTRYFPAVGQPGYVTGIHIGYDLVSEGHAPEPAAWVAMLEGLGVTGAALRRGRGLKRTTPIA